MWVHYLLVWVQLRQDEMFTEVLLRIGLTAPRLAAVCSPCPMLRINQVLGILISALNAQLRCRFVTFAENTSILEQGRQLWTPVVLTFASTVGSEYSSQLTQSTDEGTFDSLVQQLAGFFPARVTHGSRCPSYHGLHPSFQ